MAEYLPKPLRTLYCGGGLPHSNGFTSGNTAINEIERQCQVKSAARFKRKAVRRMTAECRSWKVSSIKRAA
jgi:hypothetical protein